MRIVAFVLSCFAAAVAAQPPVPAFELLTKPPRGLPAMPESPTTAPTAAMFALGQRLFADPILSVDRTVSCQSCHLPEHAFASPEPRPQGVQGRRAKTHAPALINRGYGTTMRWDGRTPTLEAFVLQPIADPDEMGHTVPNALTALRGDRDYAAAFAAVFADGITERNLAAALATFVRGIVVADAPVDRLHKGDPSALTVEQRAGLWVFESKGACWRCHSAPLFTDDRFHATGVGVVGGEALPGRSAVTGDPADRGRFKTPTLRAIKLSSPYMHDGSLRTLADVVEFYARGGNAHGNLDPAIKPLELTEADKRNLVAFLESL